MNKAEYLQKRIDLQKEFEEAVRKKTMRGYKCAECTKYYLFTGQTHLAFRENNIFGCGITLSCPVESFKRRLEAMEDIRRYTIPEENRKEAEEAFKQFKQEQGILQADTTMFEQSERIAYLGGYVDGMKYIIEKFLEDAGSEREKSRNWWGVSLTDAAQVTPYGLCKDCDEEGEKEKIKKEKTIPIR